MARAPAATPVPTVLRPRPSWTSAQFPHPYTCSRPILGKKCSLTTPIPYHMPSLFLLCPSATDSLVSLPGSFSPLFFGPIFLPIFFGEMIVTPSPLILPTSIDKYLVSDYSSVSLMLLPPEPCFIQNPHLHHPMPHPLELCTLETGL